MKNMAKFNIGDRVICIDPNTYTNNKSGVLMEHAEKSLVWVKFDDESHNNMNCAEEFGAGIRCTACVLDKLVLESEFNKQPNLEDTYMKPVTNMIKFKTGDRVRIVDDVPEVITDHTVGGNTLGKYTDHTYVPTNCIGTVLEDDAFPYVQWDTEIGKWAVHQDTLELVHD